MSRKIIENAIDEFHLKQIQELLLSSNFPWYFNYEVTGTNEDNQNKKSPHWYKFNHKFYELNTPVCNFIKTLEPVIRVFDPITLVQCRAFLTTYTGAKVNLGMHTDYPLEKETRENFKKMKVAVFYVNTNNGGTLFADGQFVESVENRMVIFNIDDYHASVTADDVQTRVVLNFNFF